MSTDSLRAPSPGQGRALPIDHLRAFLILLVVAHHAVLAYTSFAPAPEGWNTEFMLWRAFPIVDTVRAPLLDLLTTFNDTVLMALLFFLAGLFTWRGLKAKGISSYVRSRVLRLGLPFLVGSALLAPLAYYPAYLQRGGEAGFGAYVAAWRSLPVWPSGPVWFLWVLLIFSALAALAYHLAPQWGEKLGAWLGPLGERPWSFFGVLSLASAAAYVPMTLIVSPLEWFEFGPFAVQTSRIALYFLYFVFGIGMGAHGVQAGLLEPGGKLARRWGVWQGMAMVFLVLTIVSVVAVFTQLEQGTLHPALPILASSIFTVSCAASSFMLLSFFLRFGNWTGRAWRSLGRSSYGIYLVHYVFVSWFQLLVLDVEWAAGLKATFVFVSAAGASWLTTLALRKVPGVARVI